MLNEEQFVFWKDKGDNEVGIQKEMFYLYMIYSIGGKLCVSKCVVICQSVCLSVVGSLGQLSVQCVRQ